MKKCYDENVTVGAHEKMLWWECDGEIPLTMLVYTFKYIKIY
jgi:hypothetical protein